MAGERDLALPRTGPPGGVVQVDDEHRPPLDRWSAGDEQAPILLEDPPLEPLQLRDGSIPSPRSARPWSARGAEGLRLAARAIQREHVHRPEALLARMLDGQGLELVDDLAMPAGLQIRFDVRP